MESKTMKTIVTTPSPTQIVVERSFSAKRELVWKAYTEAEYLVQWWGPEGWTLPVCEVDLRVGGAWFYCMQSPPELDMTSCGKAFYTEIVAPERLAYDDTFVDEDGNVMDEMPVAKNVVTFEEIDGMTKIISTSTYENQKLRDQVIEMGAAAGIDQTFNRLEVMLAELTA